MNPIEDYIHSVTSHIHFFIDRNRIETELRNHLQDSVEEMIAEGYDEAEARQKAVQRMGSGPEIGKELNQLHHPVIGWIWLITSQIAVAAGLFIIIELIMMGYSAFQVFFPQSVPNGIKVAELDRKVELAQNTVVLDALWKNKEDELIVTYRILNQPVFSRSAWSFTPFTLEDDQGQPLSEFRHSSSHSFLGSSGSLGFTMPSSEVMVLMFCDGQQLTLDFRDKEIGR